MKTAIKVTLALALIIGIVWYIGKYHTEMVTHRGRIVEHNTTSDRTGSIDYYTVAIFEDGYVRSLRGLNYYVMPIGSTITYSERKFK